MVPAEAHWRFGVCEQAVQGLKEIMNRLATEDGEITATEALNTAVRVFNEPEIIRGFSPVQHALGKSADITDLVYYWRKQLPKSMSGNKNGGFLGRARILVTETKRDTDGKLTPGSAIWVVRGRRLLKCTPEHLRHATQREELLEHLVEDMDKKAPWTMPRMLSQLGKQEYEDLTKDVPSMEEWLRDQDPSQMQDEEMEEPASNSSRPAPPRVRHSYKRPTEGHEHHKMIPQRDGDTTEKRSRGIPKEIADEDLFGAVWWNDVNFDDVGEENLQYWENPESAVEVAVDVPTTKRGWKQVENDMQGYFVGP